MRTTQSVIAELFGLIVLTSCVMNFIVRGDELGTVSAIIMAPLVFIYAVMRGNYIINELNSSYNPYG